MITTSGNRNDITLGRKRHVGLSVATASPSHNFAVRQGGRVHSEERGRSTRHATNAVSNDNGVAACVIGSDARKTVGGSCCPIDVRSVLPLLISQWRGASGRYREAHCLADRHRLAHWLDSDRGGAWFTVSEAEELVAVPTKLLTTTSYDPASAVWTELRTKEEPVAPGMFALFFRHW